MNVVHACLPLPGDSALEIVHGDLTEEHVGAIVNAANQHLAHGGGVAGAIVRKGGDQIQQESHAWIKEHGLAAHDRPALTGPGRLPCTCIIHAVGPVWGSGDEDAKLITALNAALDLASTQNLPSIALPPISTGIFGFPKERAANIFLTALPHWLAVHPQSPLREIRITILDIPTLNVFLHTFHTLYPPLPA